MQEFPETQYLYSVSISFLDEVSGSIQISADSPESAAQLAADKFGHFQEFQITKVDLVSEANYSEMFKIPKESLN